MKTAILLVGICAALSVQARAPRPSLLKPETVAEQAPPVFRARIDNSRNAFVIEVHREWAPNAADRFYSLVKSGFYDGCRFFRVLPYFMAQFGIHGDPKIHAAWRSATFPDDPVKMSNRSGYVSFAMTGPNTRTTQVFINYRDNTILDQQGFAPFGRVVEGMSNVTELEAKFGDRPDQRRIEQEGNAYLLREFPGMSFVTKATIVAGPKPR